MGFRVKLCDYMANSGRIIRLCWPSPIYAAFAVFNCIVQPTGITGEVMSGLAVEYVAMDVRV